MPDETIPALIWFRTLRMAGERTNDIRCEQDQSCITAAALAAVVASSLALLP
jgi:hypothetical protein